MKWFAWVWCVLVTMGLGSGVAAAAAAEPSDAPAAAQAATKVWVLPFEILDAEQTPDWVGRGIAQAIVTDLSGVRGIAPAIGEKSTTPFQAARDAGASFVIVGTLQTMNGELRVLGQIIETQHAQVVGALHMTAPVENLFDIEDSVARQARRQLPGVEAGLAQSAQHVATDEAPANAESNDEPLRAAPYYASAIPPLPVSPATIGLLALINGPPDLDAFGYGGGYCGGGYGGNGGYGNCGYGGSQRCNRGGRSSGGHGGGGVSSRSSGGSQGAKSR